MRTATCHLFSAQPYSQSRSYQHEVEKPAKGKHDEHDKLHWRKHCHVNAQGNIIIPQMAFKMALDEAARMMGDRIPGKGQSTYTKYFKAGILVLEPIVLPIKAEDVDHDMIYCNANGVRGSGTRVWRTFPRIDQWAGALTVHVLAPEIPNELFESYLKQAGSFVGIGRFRPQNGGFYGRFGVERTDWS